MMRNAIILILQQSFAFPLTLGDAIIHVWNGSKSQGLAHNATTNRCAPVVGTVVGYFPWLTRAYIKPQRHNAKNTLSHVRARARARTCGDLCFSVVPLWFPSFSLYLIERYIEKSTTVPTTLDQNGLKTVVGTVVGWSNPLKTIKKGVF